MCDFALDYAPIEKEFGLSFAEHFAGSLEKLSDFRTDGLVEDGARGMRVTEAGRLFIRNIAMCFDAYAAPGEGRHSKTI
jgi:oxygen-independent coproporphyrinogen-3 oxidase